MLGVMEERGKEVKGSGMWGMGGYNGMWWVRGWGDWEGMVLGSGEVMGGVKVEGLGGGFKIDKVKVG